MDIKRNINVCLTADQFEKYTDSKSMVIVVDLLRATTVISTAMHYGVSAIIPVQTVDEALSYKNKDGYIAAAERNAMPLEGFDYGNSPFHYMNDDVKGKTLVLTTTNGTKAINACSNHNIVVTASFVNLKAVISYAIDRSEDIIVLCSGWKGLFNLEDSIFSGCLIKELMSTNLFTSNCDSLRACLELSKAAESNLFDYLSDSSHRRRLKSLNMEDDTRFCLNPDISSSIVPILKGSRLVPNL